MFFFFKQKTAYEMRISDWSSDVCSSDLTTAALSSAGSNAEACVYRRLPAGTAVKALGLDRWIDADRLELSQLADREDLPEIPLAILEARRPGSFETDQVSLFWQPPIEIGRASWRARVCPYV